jgi:transcriptional/translational regulatory protein YebC/TACO1
MQAGLEEKKYTVKETIKTYIPTTTKELTEEEEIEFKKMIDKMEDDDDIMTVYHNIA